MGRISLRQPPGLQAPFRNLWLNLVFGGHFVDFPRKTAKHGVHLIFFSPYFGNSLNLFFSGLAPIQWVLILLRVLFFPFLLPVHSTLPRQVSSPNPLLRRPQELLLLVEERQFAGAGFGEGSPHTRNKKKEFRIISFQNNARKCQDFHDQLSLFRRDSAPTMWTQTPRLLQSHARGT